MKKSIKKQLTSVILALVIAPMLLALVINFVANSKISKQSAMNMNDLQVKLVYNDVSSIITENMAVIESLALNPAVLDYLEHPTDELKDRLYKSLEQTDAQLADGNSCIIVDANGQQLLRTVDDCVNVADREYFNIVKTGTPYVSNVNASKSTGQRIVTFIAPVFDLSGNFIGAVQRNYDASDFHDLMVNELMEENQDVFFVDDDGFVIAHSGREIDASNPENQSGNQFYTESRTQNQGFYQTEWQGVKWLVSYIKDPRTDWVVVVARDLSVTQRSSNQASLMTTLVIIIGLAVSIFVAIFYSKKLVTVIETASNSMEDLSNGRLRGTKDYIDREDELGTLIKGINNVSGRFKGIIGSVNSNLETLNAESNSLDKSSDLIAKTVTDVSSAVEEIAKGATEQAQDIQDVQVNVNVIDSAITSMNESTNNLTDVANDMKDKGESSYNAVTRLSESSEKMTTSINGIVDGISQTSKAVKNINDKVASITEIASQTNLLALNASIEAARAGDAGRGFSVVAEEIGKLAKSSADTADEIKKLMSVLSHDAELSLTRSSEVQQVNTEQIEIINETIESINSLLTDVDSTINGIKDIVEKTKDCNKSKDVIVEAVSSLSAISEENAASSEETAASMQGLTETVSELSDMSGKLADIVDQLREHFSFFK